MCLSHASVAPATLRHPGNRLRQSDKSSLGTSVPSRGHPSSLSPLFPLFPSVSPHRRLKQFFSFGWGRLSLSTSSTGCCHRLILHTQIYCSDNSTVRQGHWTGFRNVRPQIVNWSQPTCEGHKSRSKLPLWEHQLLKSPYGLGWISIVLFTWKWKLC